MSSVLEFMRKLIEVRTGKYRLVYVGCAGLLLLVGLWGVGMEGDWIVLLVPYLPLIAICAVQFFRPTLLGWFVLTAVFSAYTVAIATNPPGGPVGEFVLFLAIGAVPAAALLWSWPKPNICRVAQEKEPA